MCLWSQLSLRSPRFIYFAFKCSAVVLFPVFDAGAGCGTGMAEPRSQTGQGMCRDPEGHLCTQGSRVIALRAPDQPSNCITRQSAGLQLNPSALSTGHPQGLLPQLRDAPRAAIFPLRGLSSLCHCCRGRVTNVGALHSSPSPCQGWERREEIHLCQERILP